MYGQNLFGDRHQRQSATLGAATASNLTTLWTFDVIENGLDGVFHNTAVTGGGCVFAVTNTAWVMALDADDGTLIWSRQLPHDAPTLGGSVVASATVTGNVLLVSVSQEAHPYTEALRLDTGETVWSSFIDEGNEAYVNSSPMVFNGMILSGFGQDYNYTLPGRTGGWTLFDLDDGRVLKRSYLMSPEEAAAGFGGGAIWSTPAVDAVSGYAYQGTGNPEPRREEHHLANSIVKIDVDPTRETFGEVVASYKGDIDTLIEGLDNQPLCDLAPPEIFGTFPLTQIPCLQLDMDFGASSNLLHTEDGRLMVVGLQKSGRLHAVDAETMEPLWSLRIGLPCLSCNAGTTATDGESIFAVSGPHRFLFSISRSGSIQWVLPLLPGIHFQSVSVASGMVIATDSLFLYLVDAASGLLLKLIPLQIPQSALSGGQGVAISSAGAAVAHDRIYIGAGNRLSAIGTQ